MSATKSKRLRFSIALLLFLAACVAGVLAGYRSGFDRGYATGRSQYDSEQPYVKVYSVGDVIRQTVPKDGEDAESVPGVALDMQPLLSALETSVTPDVWEALGGPSTMAPIPFKEAIIVHASQHTHDELEALLGDLAGLKPLVEVSRQEIQEWAAARKKQLDQIFTQATEKVGKPLTPVTSKFSMIGTWDIEGGEWDSEFPAGRFRFGENGEYTVKSLQDAKQMPRNGYFFVSENHVRISPIGFYAATTEEGELVLIRTDDQKVVIATRVGE